MAAPAYASPLEKVWYYVFRVICAAIFIFLISPILVMMPLSQPQLPTLLQAWF